MPFTDVLASARSTYNDWSHVGASPWVDSDNGDTSYVYIDSTTVPLTAYDSYALVPLPSWAARIISVSPRVKTMRVNGTYSGYELAVFMRYSGTNLVQSNAPFDPDGSYVEYTAAGFGAAPGGGGWTPAVFNASEAGFYSDPPPATYDLRVTYLRVVTEWAAHPGAFLYELVPFLAPVVGAALQLGELPGLARHLRAATRGRLGLAPREYREVWEALRAPRRRYA